MALHLNGSNNPNGITSNGDRFAFHPYFTFKDLVTFFLFLLVLSFIVFYYPNLLGHMWPYIMPLIVYIIFACAISWKYILNNYLVKIYNKTILVSDLLIGKFSNKFRFIVPFYFNFFLVPKINPNIVRYYYKIYNQQITKVIVFVIHFYIYEGKKVSLFIVNKGEVSPLGEIKYKFTYYKIYFILLQVGISETICTHKKIIKNKIFTVNKKKIGQGIKEMSTLSKNLKSRNFGALPPLFSPPLPQPAVGAGLPLGLPLGQGEGGASLGQRRRDNEIIKDSHNNEISLKFKQWFAGITDGDGYIYVTKEGYVGFEMTLPSYDEKVLRVLQNKFGGNIKARSGVKAVRYRTQNKETVTKIILCLNGLIINNIRLSQLHKACLALNIPINSPVTPTIDSAYLSGLLDSDGTINIYKQNYNDTFRYQLTISIANKSRCNIEFLLKIIGGYIYFDKSDNGCYFWKANSKLIHFNLYNYFLKFPPKTIKAHRTYLIKDFHELNELKAYKDTEILSMNFKKWKRFRTKWDNKN
jgi:LAGLIDADG endonuclease